MQATKPVHTHTIEHTPEAIELDEGVFSVHLIRNEDQRDTGLVAVRMANYRVRLDPAQQEEAIMFLLTSLKAHYGRIPDRLWDRLAEVVNA